MARDPDEIREDIAYAVGEGLDIYEYLKQVHEVRGTR